MKEREFSSKFRKELEDYYKYFNLPAHVQLIQDAPISGKKPYDAYIVAGKGKHRAIEFKVCKGATFNPNIVSDHQHVSLKSVVEAGGKSFVVILFEKFKTVAVIDYEEIPTHPVKYTGELWNWVGSTIIGRVKYKGLRTMYDFEKLGKNFLGVKL